jgi:hypothetical protein
VQNPHCDAGVDRFQRERAMRIEFADDHRAGAAVAFCAAFLGAGAMPVFAQILQYGARRRQLVHFVHGALLEETDGVLCHGENGKTLRTGRALRIEAA